jgi:carbohydrate diacid regulator
MEIVSREAAQQIVDTVKDVCSQNINFIDEKGLSEDTLCRVVIVRLNVRYNPNNLFMIQSAITQAFAQMNCSFYRYNYPNEYILIIEKERLEKNRHILKRLADTYEKVLCIGVGSVSTVMAGAASYD